jgi:hypothetical protein
MAGIKKEYKDEKQIPLSDFKHVVNNWHPTKNKKLQPSDVLSGSGKKIHFKCPNGHNFIKTARDSIKKKTDGSYPTCQICNRLSHLYPAIAAECHPTKNKKLQIEKISPTSKKSIYWLCQQGHTFRMSIISRTHSHNKNNSRGKCPICYSFGSLFPEAAKRWHPTKNRKTPFDFPPKTQKIVWWLCEKGHTIDASINSRANGSGCRICSNHQVNPYRNLATEYPEISKYWHSSLNGKLKPKDHSPMSGKEAYWICEKGHEPYKKVISERVRSRGNACPSCSKFMSSSTHEMRILAELDFIFSKLIHRKKFSNVEADIYIEDINLALEFDGSFYHKEKEKNDRTKNIHFKNEGIELIRFREEPLKKLSDDDILVQKDNFRKINMNSFLKLIYNKVDQHYQKKIDIYLLNKKFFNEELYREYISYFPSPLPENSLENTHPELLDVWNYKKNYPLKPKNFTSGSHQFIWWNCLNKSCNESYEYAIKSKTTRGWGCPYCSGQKTREKDSLKIKFPKLAAQWDYTKNGTLDPIDVLPSSARNVYWLCDAGHSYRKHIRNRALRGQTKCTKCKQFVSFKDARIYAQKFKFQSSTAWFNYFKKNTRPMNIPANPDGIYKNKGWKNWGDFLGNGAVSNSKKTFKSFNQAREYVRSLKLKTETDWRINNKNGMRPKDIPAAPDVVYKNSGWQGWPDWLRG